MHTSMRISADFVLQQALERLARRRRLEQVLADLGEHDLVAQQLRLLVVDQQDIDLVGALMGQSHRCSHMRNADSSCSMFTGFAR